MEYVALKDVIVEENVLFKAGNTYRGDGIDLVGEGEATMRFSTIAQMRKSFKVQRKGLGNIEELKMGELFYFIENVEMRLNALKEWVVNENALRKLVLNENSVELVARFKDGEETLPPRAKHKIIGNVFSEIYSEDTNYECAILMHNVIVALKELIERYDA